MQYGKRKLLEQKMGRILICRNRRGQAKAQAGLLAENSNALDLRLMLRASCMEWNRLQGICGRKLQRDFGGRLGEARLRS